MSKTTDFVLALVLVMGATIVFFFYYYGFLLNLLIAFFVIKPRIAAQATKSAKYSVAIIMPVLFSLAAYFFIVPMISDQTAENIFTFVKSAVVVEAPFLKNFSRQSFSYFAIYYAGALGFFLFLFWVFRQQVPTSVPSALEPEDSKRGVIRTGFFAILGSLMLYFLFSSDRVFPEYPSKRDMAFISLFWAMPIFIIIEWFKFKVKLKGYKSE